MRGSTIAKPVFLAVTLILFGVSGYLAIHAHRFIVHAQQAQGRVVEMLMESPGNGGPALSRPMVEFMTADGIRIEFKSTSASYPPSFARNEIVTVFYDPDEPQSAEIDSFFSLWGGVVITSGLCVVFAGFTTALFLRVSFAGKKSRRERMSQAKS